MKKDKLDPSKGLVVMNDVPKLLELLEKELKRQKTIEETPWKAGENLSGFGNIRNEKMVTNLIRAASMILGKSEGYDKGIEWLELTGTEVPIPVFDIDGFSPEAWKHDLRLKIDIIEQKERTDKLKEFKEKATKFMTEDQQKLILFKEMASFLGTRTLEEAAE